MARSSGWHPGRRPSGDPFYVVQSQIQNRRGPNSKFLLIPLDRDLYHYYLGHMKPLESPNHWDHVGMPPDVYVCSGNLAAVEAALAKAHQLYGDPICGTTRATFAMPCGTKVLKVPYTECGIAQNRDEAKHNSNPGPYYAHVPLADCRLVEDENGVPLLEMERVTPVTSKSGLPVWVGDIDSDQVGHTADGRLVAYDL